MVVKNQLRDSLLDGAKPNAALCGDWRTRQPIGRFADDRFTPHADDRSRARQIEVWSIAQRDHPASPPASMISHGVFNEPLQMGIHSIHQLSLKKTAAAKNDIADDDADDHP